MWSDLGLDDVLCKACLELDYKEPTEIQRESIPPALEGRDIIGMSCHNQDEELPLPFFIVFTHPSSSMFLLHNLRARRDRLRKNRGICSTRLAVFAPVPWQVREGYSRKYLRSSLFRLYPSPTFSTHLSVYLAMDSSRLSLHQPGSWLSK